MPQSGCAENRNSVRFPIQKIRTESEPSKNMTSVQTVFKRLRAICSSIKSDKNNFTCIQYADKERFKTGLKSSLTYRF